MSNYDNVEQTLREMHDTVDGFVEKEREEIAVLKDKVSDLEQRSAASNGIDYHDAPKRVSLTKVVKHLVNPRDCPLDGAEREWHEELRQKNAEVPGMGSAVWFPLTTDRKYFDFNTPNLNSPLTSAGGSNIVPTRTMGLIDILRAKSVVLRQGVTTIPAEGQISIPRKSTSSSGYWFTGDGGDSITESTMVVTADAYSPKFVGALSTFTYRMLVQTGGSIEQIMAEDLMGTLAEAFDAKALQGTGSNNQPTGVLNASGIGSLTWGGSDSPLSYPTTRFWRNDAADMIQNLVNSKAYEGNLSFLMDAATYRHLLYQEDSQAHQMFGLDADRRLFGHNVTPTTHMPASTALLGNWADFLYCAYGNGIALATDPGGTNFAKGSVSVRAIMSCDFGVRHGASFVKNAAP